MYTYKELLEKKKNKKLDWQEITKEQLEELFINENISDSMIADLYDISKSSVTYKRKKWDITLRDSYIKSLINEDPAIMQELNEHSKQRLMKKENIDWISKAIVHYIFRNGPVEDMHSDYKLTEEDMKTLNKYMVNKIATLLNLVSNSEWLKLELILNFMGLYGHDWDKAEIDMSDVDLIYQNKLNKRIERLKNDKK